jgi:hypothetical protein
VLFLCGAGAGVQLVLRSGVLTVLDLDEVDVTPSFAEVFRSVLSGVGGSTGGWRCCWSASCLAQLLPATSKNPPPYIGVLCSCFCSYGSNQHKIWAAGIILSLFEKRSGKSHLGTIILSAVSGIPYSCVLAPRKCLRKGGLNQPKINRG